jgi:hypothetical protein
MEALAMRSTLAALVLMLLSTSLAQAFPQWQIKYCQSYADSAVSENKTRLAKWCGGTPHGARWSNDWTMHHNWCLSLPPDKISEAQSEASTRLYFISKYCK